jgi:imidazole glycerol-phosphate synthase subunit HisF
MLTKRIIACLDVDAGRVVKGIQFAHLRDAGDPAELARLHATNGADEIVLLDISAAHQQRSTLLETVRRTAHQLFIPFTVGGGIRTLEDAAAVFAAGADKISINSAALADSALITRIADRFGSQAVVVAIDAKRDSHDPIDKNGREGHDFSFEPALSERNESKSATAAPLKLGASVPEGSSSAHWRAYTHGGRTFSGRDAIEWAQEAESRGAGEILLTSMDRDGTASGFDCNLTRAVAKSVRIPVIASGGAGNADHFVEVFRAGAADAALAASIFHFGIGSIAELKRQLNAEKIPMRWPC